MMNTAMKDQSAPRLGFVGLGNMGTPLSQRLLEKGYRMAVFDIDATRVEHLVAAGAEAADSLAALGKSSEVILLSLPTSAIIEEVVLSPEGLAPAMRPGSVLIDLSSAQPSSSRRIASALTERGIAMLDAPVSGGVPRARDGTLAVMVGGDYAVFERCRPILAAFSNAQFHVGPVGAGDMTKALNNLLSAITLASASEVVLVAERAGLDPAQFIEVVNKSSGRSNSTEVKFPRDILPRTFADGFALALLHKDVQIALQAAADLNVPLSVGEVAGQIVQAAAEAGFAQEGHTTIYRYLEERLKNTGSGQTPTTPEE